ncbi:hypothetical protein NMY22_g17511 [Coprinellus aureogranulatus]|nr:hypothetical protein NMY22_g17511 [Coprinellus aureogranulatus]
MVLPTQEPRHQTPDTRVALSHFLRQVEAGHVRTKTQRPTALHYNAETGELVEYVWPGEPNPEAKNPWDPTLKRVAPSDLEGHRRTHHFRGPCCLCALLDGEEYTESQISIVEVLSKDEDRNRHCVINGEFVAQCARQRCGYLRKPSPVVLVRCLVMSSNMFCLQSVCLERFYTQPDVALKLYDRRATPLPPQDLFHISDIEKSFRRGDGLFQVMPDIVSRGHCGGLKMIDPREPKEVNLRVWKDLMKGIPEHQFWDTFIQCLECKQVALREHFSFNHRCPKSGALRNERYHPYPRTRLRLDTIPGDEPEQRTLRSMTPERRESTPESTYSIDPNDFSDLDNYATASNFGDGDETEIDFDASPASPEPRSEADGSSAWPWWLPDPPPLNEGPDMETMSSILRRTRSVRAPTSNERTQTSQSEASD